MRSPRLAPRLALAARALGLGGPVAAEKAPPSGESGGFDFTGDFVTPEPFEGDDLLGGAAVGRDVRGVDVQPRTFSIQRATFGPRLP